MLNVFELIYQQTVWVYFKSRTCEIWIKMGVIEKIIVARNHIESSLLRYFRIPYRNNPLQITSLTKNALGWLVLKKISHLYYAFRVVHLTGLSFRIKKIWKFRFDHHLECIENRKFWLSFYSHTKYIREAAYFRVQKISEPNCRGKF